MFTGSAWAIDAAGLADAMEIDSGDIVSVGLVAGNGAVDRLSVLGPILPKNGVDFAYLYTGRIGVSPQSGTDLQPSGEKGDRSALTLTLDVPIDANSFLFHFYFLSAEYPEYVGSIYNDTFDANITGSAWSGNAAIDSMGDPISINSVLFSVTAASALTGTGFESVGGGTGWLSIAVPVTPLDTVTIELVVADVSDGYYDSSVVLDGFEWLDTIIDDPVIVQDIDVNYLTPKRGPASGGSTTAVVGAGFDETCGVSFDGIDVDTDYVDPEHLEVEPPAHAAGIVDVEVSCLGANETLEGAYTYYDTTSGSEPPYIDSVDPYDVSEDGGEVVEIGGRSFQEGSVVLVDGVEVEPQILGIGRLGITTPAHAPGAADVTIQNPDGLTDVFYGGLFYVPELDSTPAEVEGSTAPETHGGCETVPIGSAGAFVGFLLGFVRRSRR